MIAVFFGLIGSKLQKWLALFAVIAGFLFAVFVAGSNSQKRKNAAAIAKSNMKRQKALDKIRVKQLKVPVPTNEELKKHLDDGSF